MEALGSVEKDIMRTRGDAYYMNAHAGKDGLRWVGGVLVLKCGNYNRQKQRTKALGFQEVAFGRKKKKTKQTFSEVFHQPTGGPVHSAHRSPSLGALPTMPREFLARPLALL